MSEPVPQRIGDAERDRAAEYLREHMTVGRLTQEEFDERIDAALQARTATDLEPLFSDLPAPKPGQEVAPAGSWPQYPTPRPVAPTPSPASMPSSTLANTLGVVAGVAWPAWVILCMLTSWDLWWLVFIPIVVSSVAGQQREELKRREKLWQKQQDRQLPPGSQSRPPAS
ncbi:MAG: DUF1707 domain-containing protein [Microlunatus sp.]|nr:DUF1707 domain-containing protein [Microlunatus sp.]